MALRHHKRRVATRSAHTLEAILRAFRTRRPPKVTLRSCKTSVSYETSSKSHASSLQNERFVQDFLQKSHVKSPKRAFRTRLPPKATCQVSKTSVSYETSSKTHMSKSAKRAFRTRLPPKLTCQSLQNEHFARDFLQKSSGNTHRSTHITQPCQAISRVQPLQMRQRHSPLPQLATSRFPATRLTRAKYTAPATKCHLRHATSRLPATATKIALPHLKIRTKYCACHEK